MELFDILEQESTATLPERYQTLTESEMKERVTEIKKKFGDKLFMPGHH